MDSNGSYKGVIKREAQWVFDKCMKTVKSPFSKENDVDFEFIRKFKVSLRHD